MDRVWQCWHDQPHHQHWKVSPVVAEYHISVRVCLSVGCHIERIGSVGDPPVTVVIYALYSYQCQDVPFRWVSYQTNWIGR